MLAISLLAIEWIFFAYVSYKIGNKLHIEKSYPWYIIPLWNFWILAKGSEIKIKKSFLTLLLLLVIFLLGDFFYILYMNVHSKYSTINIDDVKKAIFMLSRLNPYLIIIVIKISIIVIFWANMAETMGKEYGVYILFGLISIYLPPLFLAFESIEKFFTSNNIFRLSREEKKLSYISSE